MDVSLQERMVRYRRDFSKQVDSRRFTEYLIASFKITAAQGKQRVDLLSPCVLSVVSRRMQGAV